MRYDEGRVSVDRLEATIGKTTGSVAGALPVSSGGAPRPRPSMMRCRRPSLATWTTSPWRPPSRPAPPVPPPGPTRQGRRLRPAGSSRPARPCDRIARIAGLRSRCRDRAGHGPGAFRPRPGRKPPRPRARRERTARTAPTFGELLGSRRHRDRAGAAFAVQRRHVRYRCRRRRPACDGRRRHGCDVEAVRRRRHDQPGGRLSRCEARFVEPLAEPRRRRRRGGARTPEPGGGGFAGDSARADASRRPRGHRQNRELGVGERGHLVRGDGAGPARRSTGRDSRQRDARRKVAHAVSRHQRRQHRGVGRHAPVGDRPSHGADGHRRRQTDRRRASSPGATNRRERSERDGGAGAGKRLSHGAERHGERRDAERVGPGG